MFLTLSDHEVFPAAVSITPSKAFEVIVDHVSGDQVRADGACGVDLWHALADVEWRSPDGHMIFCSFRRVGELVP